MKKFFCSLLMAFIAFTCSSQKVSIDFYDVPVIAKDGSSKTADLERTKLVLEKKSSAFTGKEFYEWAGLNSTAEFSANDKLYIKTKSDPFALVNLYKLSQEKGKRILYVAKTTQGGKENLLQPMTSKFNKVEDEIYQIDFEKAQGEYVVILNGQGFCFSVSAQQTAATQQITTSSAATAAPASLSAGSASVAASTSDGPGLETTISWLMKNTVDVAVEDVRYIQKLERETESDNCKLKLTVTENSSKGAGTAEVFTFNLKDLDENTIAFTVKGKLLVIDAQTVIPEGSTRQKLIHRTKGGQLLNYGDGIRIIMNTPEKGNSYADALKHAASQCKQVKKGWFDE